MIDAIHMKVAERAQGSDIFVTPACIAEIDRMLAEERTRDRQTESLRGAGQGGRVHALGDAS